MTRLVGFARAVADLDRSERFYVDQLGFRAVERRPLGGAGQEAVLQRGGQTLLLQRPDPLPPFAPVEACDQAFQHLALPVADIARAAAGLGAVAISRGGPQRLPPEAGGVIAYKFRDPDGHPLELIQFPDLREGGIDHSALVTADVQRSIRFYERLGLCLAARQTNTGPAQDRLDGLLGAVVDVVALEPTPATPHVELLGYRDPPVRPATRPGATTLLLAVPGQAAPALIRDPDGHALLLLPEDAAVP